MAVFAVKYRAGVIHSDIRKTVYSAMSRILEEHGRGSRVIRVGGVDDHVHILFSLSPNIAIADLLREVKSRTSRWINENRLMPCYFLWQRGYAVFSYSATSIDAVKDYIDHQEEHHQRHTFVSEIERLLEKYNLCSDPRDLPQEPI